MKKLFLILSGLAILFLGALPVSAQLNPTVVNDEDFSKAFSKTFDAPESGQNLEGTLPAQVGRMIQLFVSFAGVIMLVIVVYAGILWMTAGGNTDNVEKAKKLMKNAIIGLIIVMLAFVIVTFINGLILGAGFGKTS